MTQFRLQLNGLRIINRIKWAIVLYFVLYFNMLWAAVVPSIEAVTQKDQEIFAQLRQAARKNDAPLAKQLASQLPNFPFPSYVEYYQIKPKMFTQFGRALTQVPDQEILDFLQRYRNTSIADRLRRDYLLVLGKRGQWQQFNAQFKQLVRHNDLQVNCYHQQARLIQGESILSSFHRQMDALRSLGEGCVSLIGEMARRKVISENDIWRFVRLAYSLNYVTLANEIIEQAMLSKPPYFSMAVNSPKEYLVKFFDGKDAQQQLALLAFVVLVRQDLAGATYILMHDVEKKFKEGFRQTAWAELGYKGSLALIANASYWYENSKDSKRLSLYAYEWRVRSALLVKNWQMVKWSIEALPDVLRKKENWRYWYARAQQALGEKKKAHLLFEQLANQKSFYGVLAMEALKRKVDVHKPYFPTASEIAKMKSVRGFNLAKKMYAINMRPEGNHEWNWALREMSDRELLAAAAFAKQLGLLDRMVNTANRSKVLHNYSYSFPMPFKEIVKHYALLESLSVPWSYGVIRQESRFILNAKSSAGASGLMQLMPSTAKEVAQKLGIWPLSNEQLNQMDTNIRLGVYYLSEVFSRYEQSTVIASAGYNAGPKRAMTWVASIPKAVEGAIFAETIPYYETRHYVKNVLYNTTIYSVLNNEPISLITLLGNVSPSLDHYFSQLK